MLNAAYHMQNLLSQMQQMDAQQQLASYQQQSLLSGLQQSSPSDMLSQLSAQQLCNVARPTSPPPDQRPYLLSRAESYAEQGERVCSRIAFWSAFGFAASPVVSRLAERLERATDEVERFIEMAAASGIAAPTGGGTPQSGPTEGKSPTAESGDAQ